MPEVMYTKIGTLIEVPAGLSGRCSRGHRSRTNGTEGKAPLAQGTRWNGKNMVPSLFGALVFPCPVCEQPTQYRTQIRVR